MRSFVYVRNLSAILKEGSIVCEHSDEENISNQQTGTYRSMERIA
jgi:hypothetical protein